MLQGKLIITVLFVFFIGSFAQQGRPNIQGLGAGKDDEPTNQQQKQAVKSEKQANVQDLDADKDDEPISQLKKQLVKSERQPNIQGLGAEKADEPVNQQKKQPTQLEKEQPLNNVKSSVDNVDNNNVKPQRIVQPSSSNQAQSPSLPLSTSLSTSPECKVDVQRYCGKGGSRPMPNIKALQCIDDLDNAVYLISKECQHTIYKYKYNMTHDARFDDAALRFCRKDIKLLDDCNDHADERGTGRLISCLYESLSNITEVDCRNFIKHMQSMIFTDWRLSEAFTEACISDIEKLGCGRVDDENGTLPHDQGAVLGCLSGKHESLSKVCLKHVTRLNEIQSDDFQLDRALYSACRADRERLCAGVPAGNGQVYRCLYEQKFNSMMSKACRDEVHRRQKLVVSNALVDAPLIRACQTEMREHHCAVNPSDSDSKISLTVLLSCLENRLKTGSQINDECRRQMLLHRRMIMSDYALSPEINAKCRTEMIEHCPSLAQSGASGTIDSRGGRMIHCLLKAARFEKNFSKECLLSIKTLIRAVDPGNDIRADPLLETTCRPVIDALCSRVKPGDSNVIMCLLDNIKNTRMTEECEDRLMEVSYFMLRDWRLTPRLLGTCRNDLLKFCDLPKNWTMTKEMDDVQVGKYLSCLYQQKLQLESECQSELKRLMNIRSLSIGLMPEIQDNCIIDLATCKNPEKKGEEMKCLQKKYKDLEEKCKDAVRIYTKMTMSDPTLDFPMMKACESMIQSFCPNIESGNENDLLRCLVKYKNNPKMDYRCKAAIEHHQITSLKDTAFISNQFRKACDAEVAAHCPGKKTKASVIQCLSALLLRDVVKKQNEISEACREELKFELLQRGESINFDPALAQACESDIRALCGAKSTGNAQVLDCLKANRNKVSVLCFRRLSQREKIDVVMPENDYSLTTKCSGVIQRFCPNENKQNILSCLRRNANRENMPSTCRSVLYHRLMILNSDARFNKALIESCDTDIRKYCADEIIDDDDDGKDSNDDDNNEDQKNQLNDAEVKDRDMGGRIIGCLRTKYANKNADLEPKCTSELIDLIQTSKLHVQLDVKLYQKCQNILDTQCSGLDKEDCLKVLFQKRKINDPGCSEQVIRIIKEGKADIHVDQSLIIACQADIIKYCNDIPIGAGKQLQCLIKIRKSVTPSCKKVLTERQELWSSISDVDSINDLATHIVNSSNNRYLYTVIFGVILVIFFAGCVCRPCVRSRRVSKYK